MVKVMIFMIIIWRRMFWVKKEVKKKRASHCIAAALVRNYLRVLKKSQCANIVDRHTRLMKYSLLFRVNVTHRVRKLACENTVYDYLHLLYTFKNGKKVFIAKLILTRNKIEPFIRMCQTFSM